MSFTDAPTFWQNGAEEIVLRESYQTPSIEALRENFRNGHKAQILASMVGSGKTVMGAYLLRECWQKEKRGIFVVDRLSLLGQTSAVFDRYGIPHGVIQSGHPRCLPGELIQIASIQTLARRGWPDFDLGIIDECFTGETLVETTDGPQRIDAIAAGQNVYNACGIGPVLSVSRNEAKTIAVVTLTSGRRLQVTPNHPIFTESGWKRAGELVGMESVFSREELRTLWNGNTPQKTHPRPACGKTNSGIGLEQAEILRNILLEESEQPDAQEIRSVENVRNASEDRPQAKNTRRKRTRPNGHSITNVQASWVGVADGGDCEYEDAKRGGISLSLQSGSSQPSIDGGCGIGRVQPLRAIPENAGCQKGRISTVSRVASVEIIELRSVIPVFNLRVGNHPSYFAGGILVHNCHAIYKTVVKKIEKADRRIIGLTATPFTRGLGKLYSALVNVTTGNKLTKEGFLVPFKVWAAKEPDMTNAKVVAGEWTDQAASERSVKIIGDVVKEWREKGENRKTIAFGVDVVHCEELQRRFLMCGIRAELYTYLTGDEERDMMLREFRKPDSSIRVLISVAALSRGFDVPDVGCIIMCRPLRNSFTEFVQILGRGLRSHSSKQDCYVLDLAGNFMRHFPALLEFMEEGAQHLDDGKVKQSKPSISEEKKPRKCPRCKYVIGAGLHCPSCGYIFPPRAAVKHEAGDLSEFDGSAVIKLNREAKLRVYQELLHISIGRGYKKGWIAHTYRKLTGVWPVSMLEIPIEPSKETLEAVRRMHARPRQKPAQVILAQKTAIPEDLFL